MFSSTKPSSLANNSIYFFSILENSPSEEAVKQSSLIRFFDSSAVNSIPFKICFKNPRVSVELLPLCFSTIDLQNSKFSSL